MNKRNFITVTIVLIFIAAIASAWVMMGNTLNFKRTAPSSGDSAKTVSEYVPEQETPVMQNMLNTLEISNSEAVEISACSASVLETIEPRYILTDEEKRMLCFIADHEDHTSVDSRQAVMQVVMNRVTDDRFPDTVADVLYAPKQFTSMRYYSDAYVPSDEARQALLNMQYPPEGTDDIFKELVRNFRMFSKRAEALERALRACFRGSKWQCNYCVYFSYTECKNKELEAERAKPITYRKYIDCWQFDEARFAEGGGNE